jgi:hypothetical protein
MILSINLLKEKPYCFAAFGKRLVFVIPGSVFISKK